LPEGTALTQTNPQPTGGQDPGPQQQQPQQAEVVLNEKGAFSAYSNFARVTATPEEVIVDFGLNANPFVAGKQEVNVTQRLIMNFYTAKRLLSALMMTLQRHEQTFGQVELDVRRRAHLPPEPGPGFPSPGFPTGNR
jgi:hypothetical protein